MSEVTIRQGKPADLPDIIVMASSSDSAAHWTEQDYGHIFSSPRTLLVAEGQGVILGFVVAFDVAGEWELENIVVALGHRQRGIAQRLMKKLIEEAQSAAAKFIFLEVRESNFVAKRLYESCGFQPCGRRPAYYANPSEDAVLYRFQCTPKSLENC